MPERRRRTRATSTPPPASGEVTLEILQPAPYNPRTMSQTAKAALEQSLQEFGDIAGITFNRRTGRLVTGHQRMQALRDLYGTDLRMEGDEVIAPDNERYKVRVVDWDESQEKAANVAANSPHLSATFNEELLANMLDEIEQNLPALMSNLRFDELISETSRSASRLEALANGTEEETPAEETNGDGQTYNQEGFSSLTITGPDAVVNEIKVAISSSRAEIARATNRSPGDVTLCEALHKLIREGTR